MTFRIICVETGFSVDFADQEQAAAAFWRLAEASVVPQTYELVEIGSDRQSAS